MRHSFGNLQLGNTLLLSCSCSGCWPLPALYGWFSCHFSRHSACLSSRVSQGPYLCGEGLAGDSERRNKTYCLCMRRATIPKVIVGVHAAFHVLYTILATFCREWSLQQNVSRVQVGNPSELPPGLCFRTLQQASPCSSPPVSDNHMPDFASCSGMTHIQPPHGALVIRWRAELPLSLCRSPERAHRACHTPCGHGC